MVAILLQLAAIMVGMKNIAAILALLLLPAFALGQTGPYSGHSFVGGTPATTSGMNSSNYLGGIIPGASVTVYLTGTMTKATIYKDGSNTPLSNPFFSNLAPGTNPGGFIFWAATNQGLDIQAQGGMGNASCATSPRCYPTATTLQVDVYPNGGILSGCLGGNTIANGCTGATTAAGANLNIAGVTQTGMLGTSSQVSTYPGAVAAATLPLNPQSYGAVGDNAHDDTSAFSSMIAAACARTSTYGGVVEVAIPVPSTPAAAYKISSTLSPCSNLHIHGLGMPTVNYAGTGSLFKLSGGTLAARNVEIDHLDMEGTQAASTFAILFGTTTPSTISSLNDHIHHNIINAWGASGSGGGISVQNDSQRLTIDHNIMGTDGANILKTYPTDSLDIFDNILSSYSSVGGWCIDVSDGAGNLASDGGAGTQRIDHNNMICSGTGNSGEIRLNSPAEWIIESNEAEPVSAVTNAQNSAYVILNSSFLSFDKNISYAHGYPLYDFYVSDSITQSSFSFNSSGGNSTAYSVATSFAITSNVVTVQAANHLVAGENVVSNNWSVATYLNGQPITILSAGLSSTQYEFNFTHANVSSTSDTGTTNGFTFRVGAGIGNSYRANQSGNGFAQTYSASYIGIEGQSSNSGGKIWGCASSPAGAVYNFCNYSVLITNPSTSPVSMLSLFQPNLSNGQTTGIAVGVSASTSSGANFGFLWDSTLTNPEVSISVTNGAPVYITKTGALIAPTVLVTGNPNALFLGTSGSGQIDVPSPHGSSATAVQGSDGSGTSGPVYFAADGSTTATTGCATMAAPIVAPCILTGYAVDLTGQTASIGGTSVTLPYVAGAVFRITETVHTTTAGTAGTVVGQIQAHDGYTGSTLQSVNLNSVDSVGWANIEEPAQSGGLNEYTYQTTVAGATGSPQYELHIEVERIR